jgi:flagellar export protein FliJ
MARDPLPVLLRLRRLAQDAARAELAEGVRAEFAAAVRLADLDLTLEHETAAVAALSDVDLLRAAYPTWLAQARRMRRDAHAALDAAAERSGALRLQLADARAATRVVEALQARHDAARAAGEARREQRLLDEAGQRRNGNG